MPARDLALVGGAGWSAPPCETKNFRDRKSSAASSAGWFADQIRVAVAQQELRRHERSGAARNVLSSGRSLRSVNRAREVKPYFAATGNAGSLPMSRGSCWMMTVAFRLAAIFLMRSSEAIVSARSKLKDGTPFDS